MRTELSGILLAAGKGTRMRSSRPKVLHEICGQSLLERSIRAFDACGCGEIVVVVGYGEEAVRAEIQRLEFASVKVVKQEQQLGTGDAAKVAMSAVTGEKVLIAPGDIPLIKADTLKLGLGKFDALGFLSFEALDPSGFGRVIRNEAGSVQAIVEHKDCSPDQLAIREANSGIYYCNRKLLAAALESLVAKNAQGEFYLTDIVSYAVSEGQQVGAAVVPNPREVAGANSRVELALLEQYRRLEINTMLMMKGVSFEDPNVAYVDEGIEVGQDSFIGAGTRLKGRTSIGENVLIEGDSLIENCQVENGCHIKLGCSLEQSKIGERCSIGPFAHLRPGSVLESEVKVGNFVETKKATLKKGVKAGHLSYLGDATLHPGVNVGAGTITCNYDGKDKFQTVVQADSFIGSNSCLVAPVNVGEGAYIAAGSTITKDVPAGALGIGRSRQTTKLDWKKKGKQ